MLLVAGLGAVACSAPGSGRGQLVSTGTVGSAGPSGLPAPSPGGPAPSSGGGPTSTSTPTGHTTTHKTPSPSTAAPVVTASIDPIADVSGPNCPYTVFASATVAVDRGPVDVTYYWEPQVPTIGLDDPHVLHFAGAGAQSMTMSVGFPALGYQARESIDLNIVKPAVATPQYSTSFSVTCGGKVTKPVPDTPKAICPFTTYFRSAISVQYAQDVTYQWHISGGTVTEPETVHFSGPGSVMVLSPDVTVMTKKLINDFTVSLKVTSPGGGFAGGAAKCSGYRP
jgi:hypothetical protein